MEDPWGSPWAADSPPKIDLPAAPPPVLTPTISEGEQHPRANLWADEDAWGGWNDGGAGAAPGLDSPGWGRSPALRPVLTASSRGSSRSVSPAPWGRRARDEEYVDPAISLEKEKPKTEWEQGKLEAAAATPTPAIGAKAQDVWVAQEPPNPEEDVREKVSSGSEIESPSRSESPDLPPPGPAIRHDERPDPTRQGSRVQELVEMYDGFAKPNGASEEIASGTARDDEVSSSSSESSEEDSSELEIPSPPAASHDSQPSDDKHEHPMDHSPRLKTDEANDLDWAEDSVVYVPAEPPPTQAARAPAIDVPVDLSRLDELFPLAPPMDVEPEPLPDVIIDDTFASTEERKTWYRVSRFGSMRKHNLGNDDNYVRMDWAHSAAREQTLKTVRRWMEEDSIAGRVVLGSRRTGAIGTSVFNWDSAAPEVGIGELLGKKAQPKTHSRKASLISKASAGSPTVANFGWGSPAVSPTTGSFPISSMDSIASPQSSRPQSLIQPPDQGFTKPLEEVERYKSKPAPLAMPPSNPIGRPSIDQTLVASLASPLEVSAPKHEVVDDDEDDWGEMVSSPTATGNDIFDKSAMNASFQATGNRSPPADNRQTGKSGSFDRPGSQTSMNVPDQLASNPWDFDNLDSFGGAPTRAFSPQSNGPSENVAESPRTPTVSSFPTASSPVMPFSPPPPIQTPAVKLAEDQAAPGSLQPQDADAAARIISSLPDLTYMLK